LLNLEPQKVFSKKDVQTYKVGRFAFFFCILLLHQHEIFAEIKKETNKNMLKEIINLSLVKSVLAMLLVFAVVLSSSLKLNAQRVPSKSDETKNEVLRNTDDDDEETIDDDDDKDEDNDDEKSDEAVTILSKMPSEEDLHEGTWLQWVHSYTYGRAYRDALEPTWVAMTRALVQSEKVHIIAYNSREVKRIRNVLYRAEVSLDNIDFVIKRTDDVWVRDNGPIYVFDNNNDLKITDWGFNGWGYDTAYRNDDTVPRAVSNYFGTPRVDLNDVVLEGGAIEVDGEGVLMATKSSTIRNGRNENMSQTEFENALTENLGVTKFIWLDGKFGGQEDITDMHIDGFARFSHNRTIVTMSNASLNYWGLSNADITRLNAATDINGTPYNFVRLPLTANNVRTTDGRNLGYKGSYVNFYSANTVVLMPTYNDPNDTVALNLLQQLYPNKTVVGIDVRNLYENGGMVHCVTQQQPAER
jgi:agmatine deiminase